MKFVLSTAFLLLTWHLFAQNYVILHVKGTILQKDTRQPLKVGDQLNEESILVFSALDAFAVVMSKEKGRMIANAQQAKKEGTDEFVATFREILLPMKSTTSTAKGKKEDEIISFKDYFGEGNFVIIGNSIKVKVNKEKFPLDNQHFLVLKYDYEGKKINKPIPF
ncbi:MAG: hypothetical protein NZ521_04150, partial [Flammeovirgaceae bacterium]|nr:hypothetical protein [Flammeovirgaceae bacterium]MDW8287397.1 hypothetical protein [Flammeovirgaceae bacterium]